MLLFSVYGYRPDWWPKRLTRDPGDVPEHPPPKNVPESQRSTNLSNPNEDKNSDTSSVSTVSPSHYLPEHTSMVQNSPPLNPPQPKHQHPKDVLGPQRSTNFSDPNEDKNSDTSSVSTVSPNHYLPGYTSTVQNSPSLNTRPSQERNYPIHYPQSEQSYPYYPPQNPHNYQLPESNYLYYTRDYNSSGYSYHTHQPKKSDHENAKRISDWLFNPDPSDYFFNSNSHGRPH